MVTGYQTWDRVHRVWGADDRVWLLVGHNGDAALLAEEVLANPRHKIRIQEVVDLEGRSGLAVDEGRLRFSREPLSSIRVSLVAGVSDFQDLLANRVIDEVVLTQPSGSDHNGSSDDGDMHHIVRLCHEAGISVRRLSTRTGTTAGPSAFSYVANCHPVWQTEAQRHSSAYYFKRVMDIVGGFFGLLLLSPLLLSIALAVVLTSKGSPLFFQTRSGLKGRPFRMVKFRSMVREAPTWREDLQPFNQTDGAAFKMKNDPRVTPVGRFLRRHHLDELPQLWNVLMGQMSIVGPRPLPPEEAFGNEWWQRRRLSMPPGLTCTWQVRGNHTLPFRQWMESDLEYIDNWTVRGDLRLIVDTVITAFRGRGW